MQVQRVLSVSLSHAIRSAAYLLLPFSFIALVAWATAGSATGSTSDPMRGAAWLWLGAHHIPFSLALPPTAIAGYFSYLPLGAMLLPFFVIRSSFNRALDRLQGDFHNLNQVRVIFSLFYTLIVTALAYFSASPSVTPQWYLAPVFAFFLSLFATLTAGYRVSPSKSLRITTQLLSLLLGLALLVIAFLIATHISDIKAITITLQAGFFGGLLLLLLNILYIPSAAVSTLSYFAGTGFAVGDSSNVSPYWYELGQIPAFPLLGILPTTRAPIALVGILLFIAAGALLAYWALQHGIETLLQSYLFSVVSVALLSYLSSGSLMTSEMGSMGVSIWKFTLAFAVEVGIGVLAMTLILRGRDKR